MVDAVTAAGWARHGFAGSPADLVAGGTLVRRWTARWAADPRSPALADAGGAWCTNAELEARSRSVVAAYRAAGLAPGDRVLVSAAPSVDLAVAHVAALRAGLVVVPVNTAFGPAELASVVAAAAPRFAVLDDPKRAAPFDGLAASSPGALAASTAGSAAARDGDVEALDAAAPDDVGLLVFTSGTTGVPKGVPLTHANLLASSASVEVAWRWTAADRLVLALPLFHVHGLGVGLHGTLLAGASAVLLPRFDVDACLDAAEDARATLLFGVPTMWVRFAASTRIGELGRLRLCVSGSAPLDPGTFDALAAGIGSPVVERYGMTETGMLASNPLDGPRRAGSVGPPLPGVELRLADGGEIVVRGRSVFGGYLGAAAGVDEAGWFATGDVGELDTDGYLRIVGRTKELIISGGFNVYPRDIEEVLRSHHGVADVAVVGRPDPEWGERVVACVVPAEADLDTAALLDWAAERLAPYRRPRAIELLDELPRNALGKVLRSEL